MARMTLLVVVLGLAALSAQEPAAPLTGGDVVLTGVVRAAVSGEALRGARVSVAGTNGRTIRHTFTGPDGRFEIAVPVDAEHGVTISHAGHAPEGLSRAGERESKPLEVRLARGAVLRGRVVEKTGEPVADAMVSIRPVGGTPESGSVAHTLTDDRGEYRTGSLPAGSYEVLVQSYLTRSPGYANDGIVPRYLSPFGASHPPAPDVPSPAPRVELRGGRETVLNLTADRRDVFWQVSVGPGTNPANVVAGRVLGPAMRPFPDASVQLISADSRRPAQLTQSLEGGRYEFTSVPAGRYRISATTLLTHVLEGHYGAVPGEVHGEWIEVREGQRLDGMDIVLPRGGIIRGTVVNEYGEPFEGVTVHAWQAVSRNGRTRLLPVGPPPRVTDDLGRYRLHGLSPGTYYVVGAESGRYDPDWLNRYRYLSAPVVFHPGRVSAQDASPVRVDAGDDITGIDIEFSAVRRFRIAGIALDSNGEPLRSQVALAVTRNSGMAVLPPQLTSTDAKGVFEFPNVTSGEYELRTGTNAWLGRGFEFASSLTRVSESDVGPVYLRASEGSTVAGRVVLERSGLTADAVPFAWQAPDPLLTINGVNIGEVAPLDALATDRDTDERRRVGIRADGTFEAFNLDGPVRFVPDRVPDGWWLKSVLIDGVNAADEPVMFGTAAQSRMNVEAVFSNAPTGIRGQVFNSRKEPAWGSTVLAFPTNPDLWFERSRHLKRAPTNDARFSVTSLPPGDYYVAAVESMHAYWATEWQHADVLKPLIPRAQRVTVREGEPVTVDLTATRLPD